VYGSNVFLVCVLCGEECTKKEVCSCVLVLGVQSKKNVSCYPCCCKCFFFLFRFVLILLMVQETTTTKRGSTTKKKRRRSYIQESRTIIFQNIGAPQNVAHFNTDTALRAPLSLLLHRVHKCSRKASFRPVRFHTVPPIAVGAVHQLQTLAHFQRQFVGRTCREIVHSLHPFLVARSRK